MVGVDALLSCPFPSPQLHEGKGGGYLKPPIEESRICIWIDIGWKREEQKQAVLETTAFVNTCVLKLLWCYRQE